MGKLTKEKARLILHEGTVRGHPITERQRRFFGAASGSKFKGSRNPNPSVWTPSALYFLKRTEAPIGSKE